MEHQTRTSADERKLATAAGDVPMWLAAMQSLGWAFLVMHVSVLGDYVTCQLLGSWPQDGHRDDAVAFIQALVGVAVAAGVLAVVIVTACRWAQRLPGRWPLATGVSLAAIPVALSGKWEKLPWALDVDMLSFLIAWLATGSLPARVCFCARSDDRVERIVLDALGTLCVLVAGGAALLLLFLPIPLRCLNHSYEGVGGLSLVLVSVTVSCYSALWLAKRVRKRGVSHCRGIPPSEAI